MKDNIFGKNFAKIRKRKGIVQKDVAKSLSTTAANISNWETGRSEPAFNQLIEIAVLFDTTTDAILGRPLIEKNKVIVDLRDNDTTPKYQVIINCDNPEDLSFWVALLNNGLNNG